MFVENLFYHYYSR